MEEVLSVLADQKSGATVRTVVELLSNTKEIQGRLIKDLGARLLTPVLQTAQDDMRDLRVGGGGGVPWV